MMMIKINIKPFSINQAWQGRHYKTVSYKSWRAEFGWQFKSKMKNINPFIGYVEIHYDFFLNRFNNSDVDNFIKTTTDALVDNGIIPDDKWVKKYVVEKFPTTTDVEEGITIEILPWCGIMCKY